MEPSAITPALLPSGTDARATEHLLELSKEESTQRCRLELKVERALYRTAVVLQAVHDGQVERSAHHYLDWGWRTKIKLI